jgi:hypothetical protein
MTIRYMNGPAYDAVLLAQTETTLRAALRGSEDVVELKRIADTWVTEDCEPVQVDFAWSRARAAKEITEAECICSHELAAHLIHLLYAGEEETAKVAPMGRVEMAAEYRGLVS